MRLGSLLLHMEDVAKNARNIVVDPLAREVADSILVLGNDSCVFFFYFYLSIARKNSSTL